MKTLLIILFVGLSYSVVGQTREEIPNQSIGLNDDSVSISGKLINRCKDIPASNIKVTITRTYGMHPIETFTDSNGCFNFTYPKSKDYYLCFDDPDYILKSVTIKDSIFREFEIRERACSLKPLYFSRRLLGKSVKSVLEKEKLSKDDLAVIQEPPFIIRGLSFEIGDSSQIFLFVQRLPYNRENPENYREEKIIGVAIAKPNGAIKFFGKGLPLVCSLENKYFLEEDEE